MSDSTVLLLYAGTILICAIRAHNLGRSVWGWGLFALFLPPVAFFAILVIGSKRNLGTTKVNNSTPESKTKLGHNAIDQNQSNISQKKKIDRQPTKPIHTSQSSMVTPTKAVENSDSSVIDVSGLEYPLSFDTKIPPHEPTEIVSTITSSEYGYDSPRLGTRFRKQLSLTKQQADLLNKFWSPYNVFVEIEGCLIAVIRLYLAAVPRLEKVLEKRSTSLEQELLWFQEEYIRRYKVANQDNYWFQGDNTYIKEQAQATVYSTFFRRCENEVREIFGHKRKLDAEFGGYNTQNLDEELEKRMGTFFNELLLDLRNTISQPEEATEIALNRLNVNRWKPKLDELAARLSKGEREVFSKGVYLLGKLNAGNSAIENIFFEASKLMAKHDREESLRLYVHYLHYDMQSTVLNNKQLTKTIQKSLFSTLDQLQRFEDLVQEFLANKDFEGALSRVPLVYAQQRKKIQLDSSAIRQVQNQHAGTVQLLNNYLSDDHQPEEVSSSFQEKGGENQELELHVRRIAASASSPSIYLDELMFNTVQTRLLQRFSNEDYSLSREVIDTFAKENGIFRNQLIDSINDCCADHLDDVLIEEDGDNYSIYQAYYQKLTKK